MKINNLIIGIAIFISAHLITWFQINGQFKWAWFKENPILLSLLGIPISYLYIKGTQYVVESMDGLLWPTRFIAFGIGMVVYAIMVGIFFNEGITTKTMISIILATVLIILNLK